MFSWVKKMQVNTWSNIANNNNMGKIIQNILGLGGIAILSLSLTSGGGITSKTGNDNGFMLVNDSHFVFENDTFHFLSIEKRLSLGTY